jgi:hypothetical protein
MADKTLDKATLAELEAAIAQKKLGGLQPTIQEYERVAIEQDGRLRNILDVKPDYKRPTKGQRIQAWLKTHPDSTMEEIAKEFGSKGLAVAIGNATELIKGKDGKYNAV